MGHKNNQDMSQRWDEIRKDMRNASWELEKRENGKKKGHYIRWIIKSASFALCVENIRKVLFRILLFAVMLYAVNDSKSKRKYQIYTNYTLSNYGINPIKQ